LPFPQAECYTIPEIAQSRADKPGGRPYPLMRNSTALKKPKRSSSLRVAQHFLTLHICALLQLRYFLFTSKPRFAQESFFTMVDELNYASFA
jgi:hypothetical protein